MNSIDIEYLETFIKKAVQEDLGDGDHTSLSTIPKTQQGSAQLIIKEDGVLAGVAVSRAIFNHIDPELNVKVNIEDGERVKIGDVVLEVSGNVHSILIAERLVLNIMQRMSGIATMTRKVIDLLVSTNTKVLDTRKTTPGIRFLEKEAVRIGGGVNHRFGLYDMILIKDNHVDYAGGIENALNKAFKYRKDQNKDIDIEIEVRNLEELREVLASDKVDRVLLDNFDYETLKEAVKLVDHKIITEASGGITFENAYEYAACGVDYISMGSLTHSVKSLDMSLKAKDFLSN
jgi:nicotinate-nucleotide pyrophosphorylase (carboxylating)